MIDDFSEIVSRMTDNARLALQKANAFSQRYGSSYVGTEHILLGILAQDGSMGARFLADENISLNRVEQVLNLTPRTLTAAFSSTKSLSEAAVLTLRMSLNLAREFNQDFIGTEHILYSLISQKNSRALVLLNDMKVDINRIMSELDKFFDKQGETSVGDQRAGGSRTKRASRRLLSRFGDDLTAKARNGELDPVIGRDNEIERVITILSRRTKSNPVLIGEPGVGKTAIVEGLADRISQNDVPEPLIGKQIIQVDLAGMIAGTKFRGEFEERLKGLINETISGGDVILFIDELHLLAGAGSAEGSMDAANILKPMLAKGQVKMIGATTFDEYRKYIEKDKALGRRFQTVTVDEPSTTTTVAILRGLKKHYEKFHDIKIADEVLEDAVYMAERYIGERFMPDKVIDVVDEAAALARVKRGRRGGVELKKYTSERIRLSDKIDDAVSGQDYEKAALFKTRLARVELEIKKLKEKQSKKPLSLSSDDLSRAISLKTGIPASKVRGSEMTMLIDLEQHLKKHIKGQDEAIAKVAKAIRRGRSGIGSGRRPIGSFVFMGPTGVGKTELARVLASEVFGGENSLIKIDMSEFGEKHNVSRLMGAPAGYIGYDDGGKLTEAVRRHPYSVVLFDEVEKAHPDVFNVLLQILEDGCLTDGQGTKVKFNHTIVILTSNLGAKEMQHESELGFNIKTKTDENRLKYEHKQNIAAATRSLEAMMRPELVNRFDAVVVFNALTRSEVSKIFDCLVTDLRKRLGMKGLSLTVKPSAKNYLIKRGYSAKYGVRPLRRVIEDELEHLIAEGLLRGEYKKGTVLTVNLVKSKLKLSVDGEQA
jgi:ATP-dependent Clp protease ATP-binding subunit ClpC